MIYTDEELSMHTASMADTALYFPQAIDIFKKYNLDYCCQGKIRFTTACENAQLEPKLVWDEIQKSFSKTRNGIQLNFEKWNSSVLADFIVQHHHEYVRESIPRIQELLDKICQVHGDTNQELFQVRSEFAALSEELIDHLPKEEQILFPAIKRLEGQPIASVESEISPTALAMPIQVMEDEHVRAGTLIKSIRARTNQYALPPYACPTYQLTLTMLEEFDNDLIQHIHLENNILFPRFKTISHLMQ